MNPPQSLVSLVLLDWVWVGLFIGLMVLCGVIFYRLGKRSEADFFLAGRGLPWWLPATSVYATHTATDTPMWITGTIYQWGMRGIWYPFFSAWCAVSPFYSTRIFRRSMAMSQAEWQNLRFSGLGAELLRGWLAGWQTFMNMFVLAWVSAAMGKVCVYLFGWPNWVGVTLFTTVCAVYVLSAGYWGVVMADFQQGLISFAVITLVSLWGIWEAGGPTGIVDRLAELGESWRTNPFHFDAFWGLDGSQFYALDLITLLLMALLGGLGMGNFIDWYPEAQRIQSARTVRDAAYSIWAGGLAAIFRNSFWAASILGFFVLFPRIESSTEYEFGWFWMGFTYLPAGLIGMFFAAIIAIHLSTISTHLNLGALYATRDLYHHYVNPEADEQKLVRVGRINTLLLLIGSFVLGLSMESITAWLIFALWLQAAGIWLPSILQVMWWRFNSWAYLSSWIANLLMSWLVVFVLPALGVLPALPDWVNFWLLAILVSLVYVPVCFLTKPDDMDHLVQYYVAARPAGLWGPVKREAVRRGLVEDDSEYPRRPLLAREWNPREADGWSRHDVIAAVLSSFCYLFVAVGIAGLLLFKVWGAFCLVGAVACGWLMFRVIDPKMKAMSEAFEGTQAGLLADVQRRTRWENHP
ncbi:MAG TPA: sodium:solute symporter [Thermoanaerobaculia bacterium]|nr:sodium:solute symporter [Thermoanaerobaculia bacterium]